MAPFPVGVNRRVHSGLSENIGVGVGGADSPRGPGGPGGPGGPWQQFELSGLHELSSLHERTGR